MNPKRRVHMDTDNVTRFPLPGDAIQRLATNPNPPIPRGTIATFGALEADIRDIGSLARLLVTYVDNIQPDSDALSWAAGELSRRASKLNKDYLAILSAA
jgi:hypothetical protein